MAGAHPEIEYVRVGVPPGETLVGLRGMREGFLDWVRVWRDWTVTAEDYSKLDCERVLVLYQPTELKSPRPQSV